MRRILALVLMVSMASAGCGTRSATIAHTTLAVASLMLAASVTPECDADGEECDDLGAGIQRAMFTTAAVGFGLAAVVSYVVTPNDKSPPSPLPMGPPGSVPSALH